MWSLVTPTHCCDESWHYHRVSWCLYHSTPHRISINISPMSVFDAVTPGPRLMMVLVIFVSYWELSPGSQRCPQSTVQTTTHPSHQRQHHHPGVEGISYSFSLARLHKGTLPSMSFQSIGNKEVSIFIWVELVRPIAINSNYVWHKAAPSSGPSSPFIAFFSHADSRSWAEQAEAPLCSRHRQGELS